ncbi:hypothetical protein WJX79_009765 [Trebouxia sp. C0005]
MRRAWRQLSCCSQQYRLHDHWKAGLGLFPVCSQALQQLYPSTRVRLYRFSTGIATEGQLGAPQASAVNRVAQLHVGTANKQQLGTQLADSETTKTMLDGKVHGPYVHACLPPLHREWHREVHCCSVLQIAALLKDKAALEVKPLSMLTKRIHMTVVSWWRIGKMTVTHLGSGECEVKGARVLIDIMATGFELACICCGALLSAAEGQVQGGEHRPDPVQKAGCKNFQMRS